MNVGYFLRTSFLQTKFPSIPVDLGRVFVSKQAVESFKLSAECLRSSVTCSCHNKAHVVPSSTVSMSLGTILEKSNEQIASSKILNLSPECPIHPTFCIIRNFLQVHKPLLTTH